MSLRIDPNELIDGAYVIGNTGLGVLGSAVPDAGVHGASFLFNDLSLPEDATKEIRGQIVTTPGVGTFYAWEDGSFSLTGAPDGAHSFTYRLFVDGADLGTATATITVGLTDGISGVTALNDVTMAGSFGTNPSSMNGTVQLSDVAAEGSITALASNLGGSLLLGSVAAGGFLGLNVIRTGVYVEWVAPDILVELVL